MLSCRGLGIKAKKCRYEGVIVPTALYRADAWGMRWKVNVFEMIDKVGWSVMNG